MTDFPNTVDDAESLETYKGGLNAFVHVSLPDDILVDIEETKRQCGECGKNYYSQTIKDEEYGIRIEPFYPKDGHCHDCGSSNFKPGSDPARFEKELAHYKNTKDNLLGFYDHFVRNSHLTL